MQLHALHRYFKVDTPEVGTVLGLMSKKLDTGTAFDKLRDKLKCYMEKMLDSAKHVMCVASYMENTMNKTTCRKI